MESSPKTWHATLNRTRGNRVENAVVAFGLVARVPKSKTTRLVVRHGVLSTLSTREECVNPQNDSTATPPQWKSVLRPFRAEQQCRATSTANHTLVDLLCVQSSRQTQNERKSSRRYARRLAASIAGPICGRTHDYNGGMTERTKGQRTPSHHSFEVSVTTRPAIPVRRRCRLRHYSLRKLIDIPSKTCCVLARFLLCRRRKRDFNVCIAARPLSRPLATHRRALSRKNEFR